jgi:transposase
VLGEGFVVERSMSHIQADQQTFTWQEQWFVTRSYSLTARQQASLHRRLRRTEQDLQRMHAKKEETLNAFTHRIHQILHKRYMAEFLQVEVDETITTVKRYLNPGRPGPNSPFITETRSHFSLTIHRNETALATARQLAGWRIHVSNASSQQMDLTESVRYYRDEWLVEHGFHRFKKGSLPALPLYLHLPDRIRGLMLLLLIALQALTLIDFVARRSLAQENSSIAGLVPGNPKMKTDHPSAERLLAAFDKLHLVITEINGSTSGFLLESLSPLQCFILDLLHVPLSVYDLRFNLVPT